MNFPANVIAENEDYKITNMQRCPYIHEMKERLLGEQIPVEHTNNSPKKIPTPPPFMMDQQQLLPQQPVATIVKLNPDGYGSHTSPTHHRADRTPLMPKQPEDEFHYVNQKVFPKNAKTSLFIIMSFVYAKLLVVVCVAYVISDVVTHNIPLYYYEGFFTYLYGMSILFLLYVFCFLLQESSCCSGAEKEKKVKPPPKQKAKEKEKEKKKEEEKKKKEEKERQKKEKKEKEKEKEKDKDKKAKKQEKEQPVQVAPVAPPAPPVVPSIQQAGDRGAPQQANSIDVEGGGAVVKRCKRKTTQNDHSHGSFFLRIGAIAFGLGTMIYNGLEFGAFFEVPFTSSCYMILRGVNPVLQMIFTFMQMYFIFMNSRLNIHRFKVIARFGLMHVVATNICVWIRTLVLEYVKEITIYQKKMLNATSIINSSSLTDVFTTPKTSPTTLYRTFRTVPTAATTTSTTMQSTTTRMWRAFTTPTTTTTSTAGTTVSSTVASAFQDFFNFKSFNNFVSNDVANVAEEPDLTENFSNNMLSENNSSELMDEIIPQALTFTSLTNRSNDSCGRINIMGTIVQDSAPYLFPFIIEYSLIGAAVIYVMWKHIGRNPRYVTQEDLEHRLEVMLSRRAVAMAQAQQGRVDCVGASKGLFFGLLMLVGSLICLILFFVLIHHPDFRLLAIYLADASHCALMALSFIAIIIGFVRVQSLKFKTEEQSDLNDILLRVSAFGLFTYAVFSIIAGHLNAFEKEPNLLVMITGALSVLQVVLQLLFIADVSRRRVHLPEHDRVKPGRQVVTFLLICNVAMWIIYTFEMQKVEANPVQLEFYGFVSWALVQRVTLPLCIFHRFHSAVALAEIWKNTYKTRLE